jgi:hypothetical protein
MRRTLLDLLQENKSDKSFPAKKPDFFYFSDALPYWSKDGISKRPVSELESELHFAWRETPDVFRQTNRSLLTTSDADLIIENHLSFPDKLLSKLCLHKMSNVAGMSVFAKDAMSVGEFLCLYAGELRNPPSQDDHSYPYGCNHFNRLFLTATDEKKYSRNLSKHSMHSNDKYRKKAIGLVDAGKSGNISRFMQHLPTEAELKIMGINEKLLPQIATANIEFEDATYMDQDVMLLRTTRTITPSEQIGFSYGLDYWLNSGLPFFLFNKNGEPYIQITLRVSYNQKIEIAKEYLPAARKDLDECAMEKRCEEKSRDNRYGFVKF